MISLDLILGLFALMVQIAYSAIALSISQRIISEKSSINYIRNIIFGVINASVYTGIYLLDIPHYYFYSVGLALLVIECMYLGATMRIALCISTYIIVNMSTVFLGMIKFVTYAYGVSTTQAFTQVDLRIQVIILMYLILTVIAGFTIKTLGMNNLRRIVNSKGYADMISVLAILLTLQVGFDEFVIILEYTYVEQILMVMATVCFNMILYYTVLYHTVDSAGIDVYRRKTTEAKVFYNELRDQREQIVTRVTKDELTNLYNKMYIINCIKSALMEVIKGDVIHGIIFIDINGLKFVNDTYGHEAGDRLIKRIAHATRTSIRENGQDVAGRTGGDEILVFISNTSEENLKQVTQRIRTAIEEENELESLFRVSASIGELLVTYSEARQGLDEILERVDVIMRKDKDKFYAEMEGRVCPI
ncbi:MAG: hypothetical protein ATN35_09095 [Epulopiscium sp. Nele67-Bin004]|nr:MAG: hypothetical protein ATN35_09095 [Epulopiscium sp. Nele67-Bin004]